MGYLKRAEDVGAGWASSWGVGGEPVTSADLTAAAVAVTDAPAAGQKLVITDILASAAVDVRLTFTEETNGMVMAYVRLAAGSTQQVTLRSKRKLTTAAKKLMCQADAAGAVEILVGYYTEG